MIPTLLLLVPVLGTWFLLRARMAWWTGIPLWACALAAPFQLDELAKLPRWGLAVLAGTICAKSVDLLVRRPDATLGRYLAFFLWPNTLTWNRAFRHRRERGIPIELWRAVPRFGAGLALLYAGAYFDLDTGGWWFLGHCLHVWEIFFCVGGASDLIVGVMGLFGWKVDGFFRQVLRSRSVLDFWSRFDVMVHLWLKDNLFRTVGSLRHPNRGLIAGFGYSALLHEYLFFTAVPHLVGVQTMFFAIQALAGRLRLGRWATWIVVFCSTTVFMISMNAVVDFHSILAPWLPAR